MMKNILVAIDFDKAVNRLLDQAFTYSKAFGAKVWLMHIAAPEPDFIGYEVGPQYIRDFRAKDIKTEHKQIQEYAERLRQEGCDCDGMLVQGPTIEMILNESEKLNIDLIIAGHYDHGFIYKAMVGSVSNQVVQKSKVPILLVPINS